MTGPSQIRKAGFLFIVFMLGLLPGCGPVNNSSRRQDDAMLLMIASQVRLADSLEGESQTSAHGHMSLRPLGIKANGNSINEVIGLIELYRDHKDTLEAQKAQYTDRQYQFVKNALDEKISDLEQQASSLTNRRRRRGFNPFKVIGRGIGKLAKGIGKGVKFVVVEGGKLAIHFVVNKVKTTIRDVFEGRVNSILARFAGRFGPLSPWVEARLKRVLDRWWVGFRDRVSGRASRYATQTAEARENARDDEPVEVSEEEAESFEEAFRLDDPWFDQAWPELRALLVEERRNCQTSAILQWKECLFQRAASGLSQDEATEACQKTYDDIPSNDAGGSVTTTGEVFYSPTVANQVILTYPSGGGQVSGSFYYQIYDDMFYCTITLTVSDVQGTYDLETCSMSGTAYMTVVYEGMTCVSVCGPTDASPAPCPVTVEGSTTWDATLEDGVLSGAVGGEKCEPHCFGFQAPGWSGSP